MESWAGFLKFVPSANPRRPPLPGGLLGTDPGVHRLHHQAAVHYYQRNGWGSFWTSTADLHQAVDELGLGLSPSCWAWLVPLAGELPLASALCHRLTHLDHRLWFPNAPCKVSQAHSSSLPQAPGNNHCPLQGGSRTLPCFHFCFWPQARL